MPLICVGENKRTAEIIIYTNITDPYTNLPNYNPIWRAKNNYAQVVSYWYIAFKTSTPVFSFEKKELCVGHDVH